MHRMLHKLPERAFVLEMFHSLSGKVVVAVDWLAADVAHKGAAVTTCDLVTSILKKFLSCQRDHVNRNYL